LSFPPPTSSAALLVLADGSRFLGHAIGASGRTVGELVFNTALTGYQEILTDPSYCRQIVTLTYPHIGNYGVNDEDLESGAGAGGGSRGATGAGRPQQLPQPATLPEYLAQQGCGGHCRHRHATPDAHPAPQRGTERLPRGRCRSGKASARPIEDEAVAAAQSASSMAGLDLAQVVSRRDEMRMERRRVVARPAVSRSRTSGNCTWWPMISESNQTSCACWLIADAN
jgi:carbamoyl-phosphate synthase small subunit